LYASSGACGHPTDRWHRPRPLVLAVAADLVDTGVEACGVEAASVIDAGVVVLALPCPSCPLILAALSRTPGARTARAIVSPGWESCPCPPPRPE